MAPRRMARIARIRGRARSLAALSIAAIALAACNLLTGLDADYELKSDATGGEGGTEGGDPDGQTADAQSDAPPGQDASDAAVSFCLTHVDGSAADDYFCADFENDVEGDDTPTGWMRAADTFDGGTIRVVADAGIGGSRALEVRSETAAVSRQTRVYKELDAVMAPDQYLAYEVDFDFKLLDSSLDYDAYGLLVFDPQVKSKEHGVAGYASTPSHQLSRQAIVGNASPTKTVTNDATKWQHASIRLTHADAGTQFTRVIMVNSVDVDEVAGGHLTEPSTTTQLWLGVFNTSANSGRSHILFDNVVFRRRR